MKNSFLKKSVCAVMTAALLFTSTGCGAFLAKIASKNAIEYLTGALDAFYADPVSGLSDYDDSFEIPGLLDESLQFALDGIAGSSYEIGEVSLNKGRTTAKIPVTFSKVIEVEDIPMGTVDEVADALGDCDKSDVEITFTLTTPLSTGSLHGAPDAMLAVVYFDRPMYLTFTANLVRGGEVVQSIEVDTNGETIAYCEFWGETYQSGTYTMELVYDDGTVTETTPLTIN